MDTATMNNIKPTAKDILDFWFGNRDEWRTGLWFGGMHPDIEQFDKELLINRATTTENHLSQTNEYILKTFCPLLEETAMFWETRGGCVLDTQMALVILYSQFSRRLIDPQKRYKYDSNATRIAIKILNDKSHKPPWNYAMFLNLALIQCCEDNEVCFVGISGLQSLANEHPKWAKNLQRTIKLGKENLAVLNQFNRFPERNSCLNRENTAAEQEYLELGFKNPWKVDESEFFDEENQRRVRRVLLLSSSRQNPTKFLKRAKAQLIRLFPPNAGFELILGKCPHSYVPQGVTASEGGGGDNRVNTQNKIWWNATDDVDTMEYRGLEESIVALNQQFVEDGPFEGVLGFSQGASLMGILSALKERRSHLVENIELDWAILISGFYCRDRREAFRDLHLLNEGDSIDHREEAIQANENSIHVWPTFHTWGARDQLVPNWRSKVLASCFEDSVVREHPGGHFDSVTIRNWPVDQMREWVRTLKVKVRKFVKKKTEETQIIAKNMEERLRSPELRIEEKLELKV